MSPPVLTLPNQSDEFILDTDASDTAIGAELLQIQNGEEKVIAYGSMALTPEQRRYCTTRKELLAIVRFTRQYRYYLLGKPFTVRTDHNSLIWLLRFKDPHGQLARWIEELSQYNMILQYRKGKKHTNADALSRVEIGEFCRYFKSGVALASLPCGGCKFCARADQQWSLFHQEVDEAVNLTTGNTVPFPWDPGGSQNNIVEETYPTVIALVAEQEVLISEESPETRVCPVATTTSHTCWGLGI